MARNGTGSYSVPNTFVSGTTITASDHNENWDDIETEMTNSVAADGQTTMTGPLKATAGTVTLPAYTFASDPDTGWYRIGANNVGMSIGGVKVLDISSTGMTVTGSLVSSLTGLDIIGATALTEIATDDTLPIYDLSATTNKRILVSDFLKVINALTADASPVSATDYLVTYDASASAAKKVLLQSLPVVLPRSYIDGCELSNGTDATNDINIAAGVCRDSTNAVNITVAAMTGKQLDANWAPGAGAGMRNSAAGIANAWYHIWAVAKADGTQDIYAHTSVTPATVLAALQAESGGASYLYLCHIMSIERTGAAIRPFSQSGDEVTWKTIVNDFSNLPASTNQIARVLTVPTGIKVRARITGYYQPVSSNTAFVLIQPLAPVATDVAASATAFTAAAQQTAGQETANFQVIVLTDTSGQIGSRVSGATGSDLLRINTIGFIHPRGRSF